MMLYIYDILVNFMDGKRVYEFFEWDSRDFVEHIKKIPVIRVSDKVFEDLVTNDIRVDKNFLKFIENKTFTYKEVIPYAVLISNLERCYAIEFSPEGTVLFRSALLMDEEEEVVECSKKMEEYSFSYEVLEKLKKERIVFTRKEEHNRNLLKREFISTYQVKDYEKLIYLYEEAYGKDSLTVEEKYQRLIEDIEKQFSNNLKKLVYIIQLSHHKRKTI